MKILTLDIGGTAVKYGIFRDDATDYGQFPVIGNGVENIPKKICYFALKHNPDFISLSSPGPFDFKTGTSYMQHKLKSMYRVSLYEELRRVLPKVNLCFVHDSAAFAIGAMHELTSLKTKCFAAIMLGTGLGYIYSEGGKVYLNPSQSPLFSLWNKKFKDGITEDYVSTRALIRESNECGFFGKSVYQLAEIARNGESKLLRIFSNYGENLGLSISQSDNYDRTEVIVIGGQISRSWDIIKPGFERTCKKDTTIIKNPAECALIGLYDCAVNGKEPYCKIMGESN